MYCKLSCLVCDCSLEGQPVGEDFAFILMEHFAAFLIVFWRMKNIYDTLPDDDFLVCDSSVLV